MRKKLFILIFAIVILLQACFSVAFATLKEEDGTQSVVTITYNLDVTGMPEGSYYIRGIAGDAAGNQSDTSETAPFFAGNVTDQTWDIASGTKDTFDTGSLIRDTGLGAITGFGIGTGIGYLGVKLPTSKTNVNKPTNQVTKPVQGNLNEEIGLINSPANRVGNNALKLLPAPPERLMLPAPKERLMLSAGVSEAGSISKETRIGYHATKSEYVNSIMENGLRESSKGRIGKGVYVADTPQGAMAEFKHYYPDIEPSIVKVKYSSGRNFDLRPYQNDAFNPSYGQGRRIATKTTYDSITVQSLRGGTANTIIRNGSAVPLEVIK